MVYSFWKFNSNDEIILNERRKTELANTNDTDGFVLLQPVEFQIGNVKTFKTVGLIRNRFIKFAKNVICTPGEINWLVSEAS